ncbi:MAG: CHRD domain-containing protein [Actinomycetota bacterium]|nr:CHRD domain-containing protein [Actinomycetota bacterium]MDQ2984417.1 CHRD domain-containing protein [Actinomycetota bacterium]
MRKGLFQASALAALLAVLGGASYAIAGGDDNGRVKAKLNGFDEVVGPGSISTIGNGRFSTKIDRGAQVITFRLTYRLENPATQAHIHFAQRHVGGAVIAFLCGGGSKPPCPAGVDSTATVTGTITPADVIGPTTQGIEPGSFDEVVRAIRAGAVYANVHSTRWPAGEIRGQVGGSKDNRGGE